MQPRRAARVPTAGASCSVSGPGTRAVSVQSIPLVLLALGCGGGASGPPAISAKQPVEPATADARFHPPEEISRAEIVERGTNAHDAMGVIRSLRPAWLQARGTPVVYVNSMRQPNGVGTLFNIPIGQIRLMEFIGPADATTRWGTGHMGGAIRVQTGLGGTPNP